MPYRLKKVQEEVAEFLRLWHGSATTTHTLRTSGSTGTPKEIQVEKAQMENSAKATLEALQIRKGATALLCLPMQYVAGQMMVVRSIVGGLQLVLRDPSGHPLEGLPAAPHFAAMVPVQVMNSLEVPAERKLLAQIDTLIIGGGIITPALEAAVKELPNKVYATYGMTETLSHIALRRLNGPEASPFYTPLPHVQVALSEEGTLRISAPLIMPKEVVTNDLATLNADGTFAILGRKDNVINTGGIKVQIEELEGKLSAVIPTPFAITSVPDDKLGEAIVLLVEQPADVEQLTKAVNAVLDNKHHHPKALLPVDKIPLTGSGKIDRAACHTIAQQAD